MKNYTKNMLLLFFATTCSSITFTEEEQQLNATKSFDTVSLLEQINNLGTATDASGLNLLPLITQATFIGNLGLNSAIATEFSGTEGETGPSITTINNNLSS
ncbi:MAG: hypothetical protein ACXWL2_03625 [Candidatus Chromulinivorax sp.]